ncbi:hypothetical protein C8R44DRAFT_651575, partial [Mycena epipterygia]
HRYKTNPSAVIASTTANTNAVVPSKRVCKQRKVEKICDCGSTVTATEQENSMISIQCNKVGCESGWYHLECVGLYSDFKGWAFQACRGRNTAVCRTWM